MNPLLQGVLVLIFLVAASLYITNPYMLPKIIWTHWDTDELPELCRLNLERTRKILHDWDVRFFTTADFLRWCQPPAGFADLAIQHKSDYIRLWLLKHHGGTWMDISIVLNTSINDIYDECVRAKAELSGFYIESTTIDLNHPVFENWFIMAPQNSRIINLWFDEFCVAIQKGFLEYKRDARISGLQFHHLLKDEHDIYLTQHLCFQKVIQQRVWRRPNIMYRRAEDSMFYLHKKCKWESDCMKREFESPESINVPYIKLCGGERALFPIDKLKVMPDLTHVRLEYDDEY